jgi:hypothetical protein
MELKKQVKVYVLNLKGQQISQLCKLINEDISPYNQSRKTCG